MKLWRPAFIGVHDTTSILERFFASIEIAWAASLIVFNNPSLILSLVKVLPPKAWGALFTLNAIVRLYALGHSVRLRMIAAVFSIFVFGWMSTSFLLTNPMPGFGIYLVYTMGNVSVLRLLRSVPR